MGGLLWSLIGLVVVVIWVLTLVDVFKRHLSRGTTAAWVLIVVLLPIIGSILYWAMRKPPEDEVERQYQMESEVRSGRAAPPPGSGR